MAPGLPKFWQKKIISSSAPQEMLILAFTLSPQWNTFVKMLNRWQFPETPRSYYSLDKLHRCGFVYPRASVSPNDRPELRQNWQSGYQNIGNGSANSAPLLSVSRDTADIWNNLKYALDINLDVSLRLADHAGIDKALFSNLRAICCTVNEALETLTTFT